MILKLYKEEGIWCFTYKNERHLIESPYPLLDAFSDLFNKQQIYIKLKMANINNFPGPKEYVAYISNWGKQAGSVYLNVAGDTLCKLALLINVSKPISMYGVATHVYPWFKIPEYLVITEIR